MDENNNAFEQIQQNVSQQQYVNQENMYQQMNQPSYTNQQYPNYNQYPQENKNNNYALASLILGIVSFFCCGTVCSIVGLILGIISKKQKPLNNGMAVAGIVLSIISLVLSIVVIIVYLVALGSSDIPTYYSYHYSF